jgi:addiction module RelE/StbE family toxin
MKVYFHKKFQKQYQKLPPHIQQQFLNRVALLQNEPKSPLLRVHALQGKMSDFMSMNITADYRALFIIKNNEIFFQKVGTHSELY